MLTDMLLGQEHSKIALVTGATGFTGGKLALALKKHGYQVKAFVRDTNQAALLREHEVEIVEGDLRNRHDVISAVAGCDYVYHIAALYRSAKDADKTYWDVNVEGTRHVLDAAREHNIERIVHCSTVGVHGETKQIPTDENGPFAPGDIYQTTKLEGERLVHQAIESGVPATIFRPVGIYGPGDTRFLKLFKTIHSGRFRMFGSGQTLYHLTYIDDLIAGIILCGEKPAAAGQTYILAGPRYTTINELTALVATAVERPLAGRHLPMWPLKAAATLCETICKPMGLEPPLHHRRLDFFRKDRAFTSAKAERELDYSAYVDLASGLRQTAQWYFENGYLPR
jgi:dihydroflavonol-4-reductase